MKLTINAYKGADLLVKDENGGWSYAGALALCEHLEEREQDLGEEFDFNVIDIRCGWVEYPCPVEAATDFGWESDEEEDEDREDAALEWLIQRTEVVPFSGGLIVCKEF